MTIEADDFIFYKGKRYVITDCRGNDKLFDPKEFSLDVDCSVFPPRRGYIAHYGVTRDDRLVLKDLRVRFDEEDKEPIVCPEDAPLLGGKSPALDACGAWVYRDVNIPIYYWGEILGRRNRPGASDEYGASMRKSEPETIQLAFYCGRLGFDRDYIEKVTHICIPQSCGGEAGRLKLGELSPSDARHEYNPSDFGLDACEDEILKDEIPF